ncbi:MAG: hypothetical protein B1H03_02760 [Planctomycetales bacterium 4484_113]|nr:MAG: hypothetical protein B1H03_02760 [Planctomycetales bacterium 4484_113]
MDSFKEQAIERLSRMNYFHWTMLILAILALVLGAWVNPYFLLILILPVFLTPIARETGLVEEKDEQIRFISFQSTHITFYLTLLVIVGVFVGRSILEGRDVEPVFFALLMIPVIYKFFASLALTYGGRSVGLAIGYILGVFLFIYSLYGGGAVDANLVVAVLVLLVTVVSHWLPKVGGGLLALVGTAYFVVVVSWGSELKGAFWLMLLVAAPLIMAGLLLFFWRKLSFAAVVEKPAEAAPPPSVMAD